MKRVFQRLLLDCLGTSVLKKNRSSRVVLRMNDAWFTHRVGLVLKWLEDGLWIVLKY